MGPASLLEMYVTAKCNSSRVSTAWGRHSSPGLSQLSYNFPFRMQNIDTDQIIPAEYLTLVPSKVCPCFK